MNKRSEQQTASDEIILPHQQFGIVAKDPFYTFPEDCTNGSKWIKSYRKMVAGNLLM